MADVVVNATTEILTTLEPNVVTVNQTVLLVGANASGYITDPEDVDEESKLSEKERLFLACITLIVPMVCAVFIAFGVRRLIKRESGTSYFDVPLWKKKAAADTATTTTTSNHHTLPPDETKTSDTLFSEIPSGEELDEVVTYAGGGGGSGLSSNGNSHTGNHTSKSTATANGSIITMTMKNNHLIVETEEPATAAGNIDGPSIMYGNMGSNGNDVLVVELQNCDPTNQRALVHQDADANDAAAISHISTQQMSLHRSNTNTGMSQSDLSSSSTGSICHPYDYGNQSEYICEGGGPLRQSVIRSDSITCPLVDPSSQDLVNEDDDEDANTNNDQDEDNYLRLQQQLGNGQQIASTSASIRKLSGDQQRHPIETLQPALLTVSGVTQ